MLLLFLFSVHLYTFAFRRRRHYVFGLSVRPSLRSLKYPLLTCTWVRWSTRPTVTVLRHVRLSFRPSVCPSIRRGFRAFARECMEGLAEILHVVVSWPSLELISLWPWSVDFLPEASIGLRVLSLPASVRQSVRHQVCQRDNSPPVQARITKFGP